MDIVSPEHHQASGFIDHCRVSVPVEPKSQETTKIIKAAVSSPRPSTGVSSAMHMWMPVAAFACVPTGMENAPSTSPIPIAGPRGQVSATRPSRSCAEWLPSSCSRASSCKVARSISIRIFLLGRGFPVRLPSSFAWVPHLPSSVAGASSRTGMASRSRTTFARSVLRPCIYLRWPCMPSGLSLASPVASWIKSPARLAASSSWISPIA